MSWGDELREKARKIAEKAREEEAILNREELEWEEKVINGDNVGVIHHSPKPNLEKLREPIAFVAVGITKGRGEAYGWQKYALLLGDALRCEDSCPRNVYSYIRRRFKKANLVFKGCEDWSVREVARWRHWLPDPRRPIVSIENEPKEITR